MKLLINSRLKNYKVKSSSISFEDILDAKKILFSVFSRYGDGIISFSIIKEFVAKYPNKNYIVLTSRQQLPYAKEILSGCKNIEIKKINKRNTIEFLLVKSYLKKNNIDIGLNPWGHGSDSEYFITFAKKFHFYKDFDNFEKTYNLYDRIRRYFNLEIVSRKVVRGLKIKDIKTVLIAPISTDITKNLTIPQVNFLIGQIKKKFPNIEIVVALPESFKNDIVDARKFIFGKSVKNSEDYLNILKKSELFIGVDSGPLHLSLALNINSIAIFGPTSPITILDNEQRVQFLRDKKIQNHFCFVENCENPICINEDILFQIFNSDTDLIQSVILEKEICLMKV